MNLRLSKPRLLKAAFLIFFNFVYNVDAQVTFQVNGAVDKRPGIYAFTNATIFIDYQTIVKNATLLIEKGLVKQAGKNVVIPANAVVTDLKGKLIYPSFIDIYTQYGIEPAKGGASGRTPQYDSKIKGAYPWNEAIKSYQQAVELFKSDYDKADEFRKAGFGAALTFQHDGLARGTSALVALSDKKENETVIIPKAAAHFSFNKGTSTQSYPNSLMGCIAQLRQTFYDVRWYDGLKDKTQTDLALAALNQSKTLPQIIEANVQSNVLRADKIGDEFGFQFIIKGGGDEYQRLEAIRKTNAPLIVPVNFPQAYDMEDPLDAAEVTYIQMKHWELAPFNLYYLWKAEIPFAITSDGLKDKNNMLGAIRKAIQRGLPSKEALKALTATPAQLLRSDKKLGALKPGMIANFIITSDSVFKEGAVIYENWVLGEKYIIKSQVRNDIRGIYKVVINQKTISKDLPDTLTLSITGKADSPEAELIKDTVKAKASLSRTNDLILLSFDWKKSKMRLSGWYDNQKLSGIGESANGNKIKWVASTDFGFKEPSVTDSIKKAEARVLFKEDSMAKIAGTIIYPFQAYGSDTLPKVKRVLLKNATVWTNELAGILKETDVMIENGKIIKIGKNLSASGAEVVDATNKHITSGIIDEHSHIAISGGVNECSNSNTGEVRIGDILNAEDIDIYRNLAGGVTAAQILHGSCNSIGGQSGIIKLRWGKTGEEMKIANADGFIKFALGENVKQSNWGDDYSIRFPQTRMGVEQVYVDAFTRAREYEAERKLNPLARKDLQLDAMVEILNKKRFITCHSYVKSEIIMLMRVAEKFNIRVNTFTHILEGYKVADKMKEHGAGGSTFADWWAYKFEVKDAIPYNPAIMHKVGVITAINSDDAEMARRLNQEAAKVVKYGNVSEEDALKMVTLNPAKLLHLDKITGSIKEGKDADIVVWSDNPLSIYAKAEQTYVDGIRLFDINRDSQLREAISGERTRLVVKMMEAKKKGEPVQKAMTTPEIMWDCEGAVNPN